ncbi:MAG: methionine synthase [Bacteroidales bacterium]|nr:methionine synthase [Candidatus Cacconaster merdequi]
MIEQDLKQRILVLDGAMGTMIQKSGYSPNVPDNLNLTHPEVIEKIHRQYIEDGADIIETNTFNLCSYQTTYAGVSIARRAADSAGRKVYVAGVLGPHCEGNIWDTYSENAKALIDGGADTILIETIFQPLNMKAALYALTREFEQRGRSLPVMVSATVNDRSGRLLGGTTLDALYNTASHCPLLSFGLNCSFGAAEMVPFIQIISKEVECAVSMHPNAGLPNHLGEYEQSPEAMAAVIREAAENGLINIAGGCCGTTPEHIKAIADVVRGVPPRRYSASGSGILTVSGLETVKIDRATQNFVNVGERANVAGSRKFARLIGEKKYGEAASIARKQVEDGANVIDINMDDPMLDPASEMTSFIQYIQEDPAIAKAALMIDSSDWNTILAGLRNAPGKCIVNSISLKEGEDIFLEKAKEIRRYGAAVIVMAFDEEGQATDFARKKSICERAYHLLTQKAGYSPADIIFDVNVLTIGTSMESDRNYAVDFIEAVRWIKANLPGCHCSGGVSNLSFAFRGNNRVREAMHSAFIYHAVQAGLDMAIVNPSMLPPYDSIDPSLLKAVEDVILNSDSEATSRLVTLAESMAGTDNAEKQEESRPWRLAEVGHRLQYALSHGTDEFLKEDIEEALAASSAIGIIEGPLLKGMENVGQLFSEGKMFLPQVVKAARIMRTAVDMLQDSLKSEKEGNLSSRRKMILATVKGDVHDIGKNILSTVLSCNNIDIIDLGVMVEPQTIIESISKEKADLVGVSGLISPSLKEMEILCREMEKAGCSVPLFVGGATASSLHTAVKLAPLYHPCVAYTNTASDCSSLVSRIIRDPEKTIALIKQEQQRLRELHESSNESFVSIEQARERAQKFKDFSQKESFGREDILQKWIPVESVSEYIDWSMFLSFWGFKDSGSEAAKECLSSGRALLSSIASDHSVEISCISKFYPAHSENEDIIIEGRRFNMHRSTSSLTEYASLADFVPEDYESKVGLFAVKVEDHKPHCCDCKDYEHLLRESVCARLAEATAQWLQEKVAPEGETIRPAFGYASCPEHSLKETALRMIDPEESLNIRIEGNYAMIPKSSICGMFISHPCAKYINLRES